MGNNAIRIGLIGFGTIGTGVVKLLQRQRGSIRDRVGVGLDLVRIADVDTRRDRGVKLGRGVLVGDARRILDDPAIDIVIELMGGTGLARRFVMEAIAAGKDVVTANKALLAHHGDEIFRAAERQGVQVAFEASVGGGIPIIRVLKEGLCGDRNQAVYGIVNGTSNYILSRMSDAGGEFADVLRSAQADGLAEADPSFDVDGIDAAHKLTLLIQLAFGVRVPFDAVRVEGIRHVSQADIAFAREFGYAIKSLAVAKRAGERIEASVQPTMVSRRHPLAEINGALNAIVVHGEALGPSMYVGAGAGMMPTATAVVADLMAVARDRLHGCRGRVAPLGYPVRQQARARALALDGLHGEYYLRFMVVDRPGVLGRIAGILGQHEVSIASVIQREREHGRVVPVVIRTHDVGEQTLRRAVKAIDRLSVVRARTTVIRIEESLS
ncbi:homoserine dehydrogenase [bacterium]|nr:homoserine dehydrogenase [bacterium]